MDCGSNNPPCLILSYFVSLLLLLDFFMTRHIMGKLELRIVLKESSISSRPYIILDSNFHRLVLELPKKI